MCLVERIPHLEEVDNVVDALAWAWAWVADADPQEDDRPKHHLGRSRELQNVGYNKIHSK